MMKKLNMIVGLFLCTIISCATFSKEVYINELTNKEYLFLGSIDGNQKKYLELESNEIKWISDSEIKQQTAQLTPKEFYKKILDNNLVFHSEGYEPFWEANLSNNTLKILLNDVINQEVTVNIAVDKFSLDGIFILMFDSKDKQIYGMIRMLSQNTLCDLSLSDEDSVFEVFINYKGTIIKGCSYLDLAEE